MTLAQRREHPRIKVRAGWRAQFVSLGLELDVVDVSFGGMQLQGSFRFDRADDLDVVIKMVDGSVVATLKARPVYCRRTAPDATSYLSGMIFVEPHHPPTHASIEALLTAAAMSGSPDDGD